MKNFKRLKAFDIGTFQSFQETYHRETYKKMHPTGLKANYDIESKQWTELLKPDLNDVGIGALFGLTDYRFEVLAILCMQNI